MPLFPRAAQANTSQNPTKSGEAPGGIRPVTPVVEVADEPNEGMNPYRGFDPHGVRSTTVPEPVPSIDGKTIGHYSPPKSEPEPIPVRVVREGGRELSTLAGSMEYASGAPRSIVGQNADRTEVTITNNGAVTVWLNNNMVGIGNGYPLAAGQSVTWKVQTAIYAVSNDGSQVQLAIAQFYSIPLDPAHSVPPGS